MPLLLLPRDETRSFTIARLRWWNVVEQKLHGRYLVSGPWRRVGLQ
jgi:hypothetical protein